MSSKEWTAVVQLVTGAIVLVWLGQDFAANGLGTGDVSALAWRFLWITGTIIVLNIVGAIVVAILVTAVTRTEYRDEPADERDDVIDARSSRIAYTVTSILAAGTLFPLAFGFDPNWAVAMLFLAPLFGGLAHAAAQLVLYRMG